MTSYTTQKNMDLSGDLSDYSDNYSDDEGYFGPDSNSLYEDRFEDSEDEDEKINEPTRMEKIEDEIEQWENTRPKLQDPDTMEFILPARKIPTVEEMDREFYDMLARERRAADEKWAVTMIEDFFCQCLKNKHTRDDANYQAWRSAKLAAWKKARNPPVKYILSLKPIGEFETEYKLMEEHESRAKAIKKGIADRLQSIRAAAEWKIAEAKREKARRATYKQRARAKQGMNKKSAWHKDRQSGALVFATKTVTVGSTGEGKRVKRKERRAKEREEAHKQATRMALMEAKVEEPEIDVSDSEEDERTQEERDAEATELANALAHINKACIEKAGKWEQYIESEKKERARKATVEKKEKDSWTMVGYLPTKANKKPKKMSLGEFCTPISLLDQATKRRVATDEKYAKRCEAFDELGDKDKLEKVLKFTQMCRSVIQKKKCYHKNCRFAHSIEQLVKRDCRFGLSCNFVKAIGNGNFVNKKFGHTGKTCACYHPQEHERSFCQRMNIEYTPKIVTPKPIPKSVPGPFPRPEIKVETTQVKTPESVWAKVVSNAEQKEKAEEAKAKMTKSWNQVVIATLTDKEKSEKYGIGAQLLGKVSEECGNIPIIPTVIRKTWDKRGLGFSFHGTTTTTKVLVTTQGFSWVAGKVLQPKRERKQRWDVVDPKMVKVFTAVAVINQKIAIETAKAKAVEINERLQAEVAERKERKTLTKVKSSHKLSRSSKRRSPKKIEKPETVIYRVPKDKAELAMLSAIRSGITDFRIEIIR